MSLHTRQKTTTSYRTVKVASPEPVSNTVISASPVSTLPYGMNGSYETVRYLVPMQQQSYVLMQQPYIQQPMMQQMVSPVYVQGLQHLSVSSQESDMLYQQQSALESVSGQSSSVFSQSSSPIKSPEPSVEEEQNPPPVIERISRTEVKTEQREAPQLTKLDTRYFGELLAEVYRKNCDIHSCISEHVSKIRGQKHQLDPSNDYKTRLTADKSMRLLLSTFSSLREELLHMSEDLRLSLKETTAAQRSLESQLLSSRSTDSGLEFKIKELEGQIRVLQKENEMLRQKQSGQASSSALHIKTEELSRQYNDQLSTMRQEKDREIERLRSQITKIHTEITTERSSSSSSEKSLQLKISELLAMLDQRQTTITRQEEEIKKLMQEKNDSSKSVTKTIITKRYRNQYPILGLLSDDYQMTSPVKEAKTIVIERTGEMIKQEIITTP
eukprot:superscaffoldBa00002959_g15749